MHIGAFGSGSHTVTLHAAAVTIGLFTYSYYGRITLKYIVPLDSVVYCII